MSDKPETKLAKKIRTRLKNEFEGIFIQKIHGGPNQISGLLDFTIIWRGIAIWLEVKMPNNKKGLTKRQEKVIEDVRRAGGVACCVRSPTEAYNVIRKVEKNVNLGRHPCKGIPIEY